MFIVGNIEENSSLEAAKDIEVDDIEGLLLEAKSNIKDIGLYGVRYQLKRFAGIDTNTVLNKCTIEHGLVPRKDVWQPEVQHHVSCILTYSPYREDVIRELTELTPTAIGPYIAYAENYRAEKVIEEKKSMLGRTLLVMPVHSATTDSLDPFFQEIERLKTEFDTVLICMYVHDLELGLWKPFKIKGCKYVSAGQFYSPHFLSRLKYILSLSDALILNEYTTGMAYAMYMGLPIHLAGRGIMPNIMRGHTHTQMIVTNKKLYRLFDNDQFVITAEQLRFGEYMFGLRSVKTKKEMRDLLLSLARTAGIGV